MARRRACSALERGFDRYPLLRGHQTGSRDGEPVAPLLGTHQGYDGGATDLHLGPMTFGLAYCDHVVLYRFTPRGLRSTDCEITWLVNETAVEGKDYDRRRAHLALGRHDDRGQADHRAQPGGRGLALLRARAALADGRRSRGSSWSGTSRRCAHDGAADCRAEQTGG